MGPYVVEFFGERWDAPRVDDAVQVPTPVGEPCLYCTEPIEASDRGLFVSFADMNDTGELVGGLRPVHMECDLRSSMGSLAHLEGRCSCSGGSDQPEEPSRANALATLNWINTHWRADSPL